MINPPATTDSDIDLVLGLHHFDLNNDNKKFLFQIKDNSKFEFNDKRIFIKICKRRKRYICKELKTGKRYLFLSSCNQNIRKMKIVAVSGYFDPIHVGHLEYLRLSKKLGDKLVVIVNNNHQCVLKKGKPFMDEKDRVEIVRSLEMVDEVFLSIDDDKSVCKSLEKIKPHIFANGGDRSTGEVPESTVCKKYNIQMTDGLRG